MTRLIDADKFKDSMKYVCDSGGWLEPVTTAVKEYVVKNIDAQPTVDAEPVRHGKWVEVGRCLVCSCCGKAYTLAETNYCWQCGAKMEVDDETD